MACAGGRGANALAQAADFIALGLVPSALELGMAAELAILKHLASIQVQDRHGPGVKY